MAYEIEITRAAKKSLKRLAQGDATQANRIRVAISDLASDPRPHGYKKLSVGDGYRIRVGSWRVIYTIDDDGRIVIVNTIADRSEVYR